MFDIQEELKKLPDKPGVYIMHDAPGNIIYVGKAINLKRRVSSYFQTRPRSPKIAKMISLIDHFEYVVVGSEMEAFVLECNLIKENRPKYNTMLMDDKSYPFIKVTNEPFPRVFLTRQHKKDGGRYFGPYTNVGAAKQILELMNSIFTLRPCKQVLSEEQDGKPCLYYQMKQCNAPCAGKVSREEYAQAIDAVTSFLAGDSGKIKRDLEAKMKAASAEMAFEQAAVYRDLIRDIEQVSQVQRVTVDGEDNRDVIGLATAGDEAVVQVFFIRGGKMTGREHFYLTGVEHETRADVLNEFVKQYYSGMPSAPRELLVSENIPEAELIGKVLSDRSNHRVYVISPQKGEKKGIVKLACQNASEVLVKDSEKLLREQQTTVNAARELGELIGIGMPHRIECYDISNISGFESVGSMTVFEDGKPKNSDYRKFRIKTVVGPDDYASMAEVLTRRFEHGMRERAEAATSSFTRYPDLILMDGGRGQVNVALEVLERLGIKGICVCGLVKDDNHRTRGIYHDNIEMPVDTHSEYFKLMTRIQDETHRFAIEYHRLLRSKEQVKSILDDIEGIGPARRLALMRHFTSLEAVRKASVEELASVGNMNRAAAEKVYEFFRKK